MKRLTRIVSLLCLIAVLALAAPMQAQAASSSASGSTDVTVIRTESPQIDQTVDVGAPPQGAFAKTNDAAPWLALFVAAGCLAAAGCVGFAVSRIKKDRIA